MIVRRLKLLHPRVFTNDKKSDTSASLSPRFINLRSAHRSAPPDVINILMARLRELATCRQKAAGKLLIAKARNPADVFVIYGARCSVLQRYATTISMGRLK